MTTRLPRATIRPTSLRPSPPPGDNIHTARHIARECGILTEEGLALEGPEFRCMPEEQLLEVLPRLQVGRRAGEEGEGTHAAWACVAVPLLATFHTLTVFVRATILFAMCPPICAGAGTLLAAGQVPACADAERHGGGRRLAGPSTDRCCLLACHASQSHQALWPAFHSGYLYDPEMTARWWPLPAMAPTMRLPSRRATSAWPWASQVGRAVPSSVLLLMLLILLSYCLCYTAVQRTQPIRRTSSLFCTCQAPKWPRRRPTL